MTKYIGARRGPFAMTYSANRSSGVGVMLSQSSFAWVLSFGAWGRGLLVGWCYFGHPERQFVFPRNADA